VSRSVPYRILLFAAVTLAAVVFLLPTFVRPAPTWWPWQQPVRLGLDLQGGTHLLYGVDIDQAVDTTLDRQMQDLERELRDAQIGASTLERDGRNIHLRLANVDKRSQVLDLLKDRFPSLVLVPTPDAEPGELAMTLEPREIQRVRDNVQEQALKIIRNRIDQFGVAEPTVQAQGADEIVVQLPGIQDPERAKELIGRTALLEFRLLAEGPQAGTVEHPGPGVQVLYGRSDTGRRQAYLVERRTLMTGDVLTDASVSPGTATEGMAVEFVLDARGAKQFGQVTSANVSRRLAIILDGMVESAPTIREPITGGRGQITGRFQGGAGSRQRAAQRRPAGAVEAHGGAYRRPLPRKGLDPQGSAVVRGGDGTRDHFHARLLPWRGGDRGRGPRPERAHHGGGVRRLRLHALAPGHRGYRAHGRHGGRRQRPHPRAHPRGAAAGQDPARRDRGRIRTRLVRHPGFERDHLLLGTDPLSVRNRSGARLLGILTSLITGVFGTRVVYDAVVSRRRLSTVSV